MKKVQFFLLLLPLISFGQNAIVSGNAFWKYNSFVGNRPDAGAEVLVCAISNPQTKFEAKCDVSGNYKIENVPDGRYLIIVKSKSTTEDPFYSAAKWNLYKQLLDTVFSAHLSDIRKDLQVTIDSIHSIQKQMVLNYNSYKPAKYLKEMDKLSKSMIDAQTAFYKELPGEIRLKLDLFYGIHRSLYFETFEIKNGHNVSIVTDFGATYM